MKHLLTLLAALTILAAPAAAQTIKSLGYNSTNGQIVAATNAVWTNAFNFSTNTVAAQVRTNLGIGLTALTNTNVTSFRSAIGLGTNDQPVFNGATITGDLFAGGMEVASGLDSISVAADGLQFTGVSAAITRTNLGLGSGITTNRTFVSYNGTNYTTNSVSISNGIITGWTQ